MIIENNDKALAEEISSGWRRSKRIDGARKFLEEEFPPVVVTQVDQCDRYDREQAGSFSLYSSFYALLFFLFFFPLFFPSRSSSNEVTSARTTFEPSAPLKRQSGRKGEAIAFFLETSVSRRL